MSLLGRRKTDWKFESLHRRVDDCDRGCTLFIQNARGIYLKILDEDEMPFSNLELSPLNMAIRKLATCSHIRTFSIILVEGVNLDVVAASFPSLEALKVTKSAITRCHYMDSTAYKAFRSIPGVIAFQLLCRLGCLLIPPKW